MAAPVADKIILPLDTGNTGKKKRTQTRVVGADTVHEDFVIMGSTRSYLGVHGFSSGNLTILAAAQNGTSTGSLWIQNPVGSAVRMALARLCFYHAITTNLSMPTAPRIIAQLFTFTGTASGAALTTGKFDSRYPAAVGSVRTAVTGMTVTLGGILVTSLPIVTAGTAGWTFSTPDKDDNVATSEMSDVVLAAGEGLVIYQADAGTTSDTRKLVVDGAWSEFDAA
jgi:hypothetical protein